MPHLNKGIGDFFRLFRKKAGSEPVQNLHQWGIRAGIGQHAGQRRADTNHPVGIIAEALQRIQPPLLPGHGGIRSMGGDHQGAAIASLQPAAQGAVEAQCMGMDHVRVKIPQQRFRLTAQRSDGTVGIEALFAVAGQGDIP